jgi:hypothetical protein
VACSRVSFTQKCSREWNTILHDSPVVANLLCAAFSQTYASYFGTKAWHIDSDNFRIRRLFSCARRSSLLTRGRGLDFLSFLNISRPRTRITNWKFVIPNHSVITLCKVYMSRNDEALLVLYVFFLHTHLPMKMEQCSETSAYKIQTPGNYPEEKKTYNIHNTAKIWNQESFVKPAKTTSASRCMQIEIFRSNDV